LRVVKVEQSAEEQRAHFAYRCAHGRSLLAEDVPERNGRSLELEAVELHLLYTVGNLGIVFARLADAREVALHVCGEHRHTDAAEGLSHDLERDGLAGTGGTGHQTVAVSHLGKQILRVFTLCDEQGFSH
jgi:hypothetical protein